MQFSPFPPSLAITCWREGVSRHIRVVHPSQLWCPPRRHCPATRALTTAREDKKKKKNTRPSLLTRHSCCTRFDRICMHMCFDERGGSTNEKHARQTTSITKWTTNRRNYSTAIDHCLAPGGRRQPTDDDRRPTTDDNRRPEDNNRRRSHTPEV